MKRILAKRILVEFTCPKCGEHRLEEVSTGIEQTNEVFVIYPEGGGMIYGPPEYSDGDGIQRYVCGGCCEILRNKDGEPVKDLDDLVKWLGKHKAKKARKKAK